MSAEQDEYQRFARDHFTQERNLSVLAQLNPEQTRYANEYQEQKVARARKYPRLYAPYAPAQMVRLRPLVAEEGGPRPQFEMRLEKTLVEIGKLPKVKTSMLKIVFGKTFNLGCLHFRPCSQS